MHCHLLAEWCNCDKDLFNYNATALYLKIKFAFKTLFAFIKLEFRTIIQYQN